MNIIASADQNWAIGKDNQLLIRIPEDMKRFRQMTTGNVVVMGRKTLESFPNQAPLKDRVNIVMTRNMDYQPKGVTVVHSVEELQKELEAYDTNDVYVIGGDSIYKQLLDLCDTAHITKIDYAYAADSYFPNLEERDDWKMVEESEEQTYFDVIYTYQTYKRV
ncbi:MAG: dihydrofolate reductase [Lachnospiraceae bacterium]|nr:dihydrofolate reductase [Lachnospiraceae bacterium]